jgi:hypothetical protein
VTRLVILRAAAGSTLAIDVAAEVDSATARGMTWLVDGRLRDDAVASLPTGEDPEKGFIADLRDARALRAVTRLVILREVAGSTLAIDVAAEVDSATARGMTWLVDGRLRDDAVASLPTGEDPEKSPAQGRAETGDQRGGREEVRRRK